LRPDSPKLIQKTAPILRPSIHQEHPSAHREHIAGTSGTPALIHQEQKPGTSGTGRFTKSLVFQGFLDTRTALNLSNSIYNPSNEVFDLLDIF
jgi:hypothetical protein